MGMGTAWLPVLERLLYPLTFISGSKNDLMVYLLNAIYYIIVIAFTLALAIASCRLKRMPLRAKTEGLVLLVTGLCASFGVLVIWVADVSTLLGSIAAVGGTIAVALYFPLHFVFWGSRISQSESSKHALTDAMLSFAFTAALFMLYGIFDIRVVSLAAAFPALSAVLGFLFATRCKLVRRSEALQTKALWQSGMFTLCLILLLLCNVAIAYLNNSAVLHADMPYRWLSFCGDVLVALIIAALYLPNRKTRRPTMSAFLLVTLVFVALLLIAVLTSDNLLQQGTIPLHCANAVLIVFGWLMIVRASSRQNRGLVSFMSFYLAFAVLIPRFLQAIIMYEPNYVTMISQSLDRFVVIALITLLAVGLILFVTMKDLWTMIDAAPNSEKHEAEACGSSEAAPSDLSDEYLDAARRAARYEIVLTMLQESASLSDREMDVARLALENYSAKKMADSLYVSVNTIYSHLKSIYRKTGVHSREEFIAFVDNESSKI